MADFEKAFPLLIRHEGGYVNDPDDPGGETYRGITRRMFGKWEGWTLVDMARSRPGFPGSLDRDNGLQEMVMEFYRIQFWERMQGDRIIDQEVAFALFDFGVNAGLGTSVSLAQMVIGAKSDGVIGPKSLEALNSFDPDHFLAAFTVAKIARYVSIVKKRPSSQKYFYGWVRRAIGDI